MANTRKLTIEIVGDASGATKAFGQIESGTSKLSGKMKAAGAAIGGAFVFDRVAQGVGTLISAAEESNQVTAQTDAVLKSMGNQAGITADQVAAMSETLAAQTGVDDELIQSGQNVLLTFGQVQNRVGEGNNIFDRASKAALDMSVALGTDMNSAAIQVGKALNDPVRGLTALRRSGIQFTKQQEDQIKAMAEAGDTAGAQRIMLEELEKQFGGSAAAQATASGKMSVAWGNLQESLGEKLLPIFEKVSEFVINTLIPGVERFSDWASENKSVVAAFGVVVVSVLTAWGVAAAAAAIATSALTLPIFLVAAAVGALAYLVITHWDTIKRVTVDTFNAVKDAIMGAFNWVKDNWPLLLGILTGPIGWAVLAITRNWDTIKRGAAAAKDWIVARFNDILGFFQRLPGQLSAAAGGMWDFLWEGFTGILNRIIGAWNNFGIPSFTIGGWDIPGPGPNVPSFTTPAVNFPDIPYLASGGIVTGPTLAMLGEGGHDEAVIPLDGRSMGDTVVNVYVSGSVLSERDLVSAINRATSKGIR